MLPKLKPALSKILINQMGQKLSVKTCGHTKIPGLDAEFCPECCVYYVDEAVIHQIKNARKGGGDLIRDREAIKQK